MPECNERGEYSDELPSELPDSSRVQIKVKKTCSLEEIYALVECTFLQEVEIDDEWFTSSLQIIAMSTSSTSTVWRQDRCCQETDIGNK